MLNTSRQVLNVCVSGAAGNIAHSFYNALGSGEVFGAGVEFNLRLLELPDKIDELKVLLMEIEDCCFLLLKKVTVHCNPDEAFDDLDFAILMGGASRKPGMQRKDLFDCNRKVFEEQGKSLNTFAKKTCKILVVANPANTNCLIVANNAPSIPKQNFSCLSRLDYNRAVSQVAIKSGNCNSDVKGVVIWGNHSLTQFPDLANCTIKGQPAYDTLPKEWIEDEYISVIQKRGGKILTAKGVSSSISAANAIKDHIRDWKYGSSEMVSMAVILEESVYGIPADLCVSMPVMCKGNFKVEIVSNLVLTDFQLKRIRTTTDELVKERTMIINKSEHEHDIGSCP